VWDVGEVLIIPSGDEPFPFDAFFGGDPIFPGFNTAMISIHRLVKTMGTSRKLDLAAS
jgi:hypothetical protein